jgi:tetratricopeptide (TPR) repeat protein
MTTRAKPSADPVAEAAAQATRRFTDTVEEALKRFQEPAWLGQHSPLAMPYFLGGTPRDPSYSPASDPAGRGQALQRVLRTAAAALPAQNARWGSFWARLLELTYFSPRAHSVVQIVDELSTSEAAYHRHRNAALAALAQEVIRQVKPALRLETPAPPPVILRRDDALAYGVERLSQGKSVGLSGPGGIGKTALGAALAQRVAPQGAFWYTFTPGLNDQAGSLLFALAYFLHGQGASTLWLQLVADHSEVKPAVALNLLRHDLASLPATPRLLCFDEVDLLRPGEVEAHTQLAPLLEQLRGLVPLLLIGQKPLVETDSQLVLGGLAPPAVAHLLQQTGITLNANDLAQLHSYTGGNPRLLELFIALYGSLQRSAASVTSSITEALASFAGQPSLEFLLRRIWQHLNESEMYLLELLAVFRHAAPRAAWSDQAQQMALDQLVAWRLVHADAQGGVYLLPALRDTLYHGLLTSEEKELLHLEAAALRAQYAQFTAAAHHYAAGGEATIAIRLWYAHREQEIDQGRAGAALALLQAISPRRLTAEDQEMLALLCAELQKLVGQYDAAAKTVQATYWRIPFLKAQAWRLEGDIAELRGEVGQAQQAYLAGQATVEQLLIAAAHFHRDLGYLYTNDVEFERAQREVLRLRHEAANLEGFIAEMRGELVTAATAYQEAFRLAQATQYAYGEANTHNNLGRIYAWQRQLAQAEEHLQEAIEFFRNTGRLNKLASATYNLALAQRLSEHCQAALAPAQEALQWFEQLDEAYGQAVANQVLAEIHLGLNELDKAEQFARRVLDEEHTTTQPDGLRTLGEIRLQQGKLTEAEALIRQSLSLAQANQNGILAGYAWRALGQLQMAQGEIEQAATSFTHAEQIFREQNLKLESAQTLALIQSRSGG